MTSIFTYRQGSLVTTLKPVVHKGIPIPPERQTDNIIYTTARKLSIGDCMDIPYTRSPVAGNLARALGYEFRQRKVGNLLRIWRVK